MLCNAFDDMSSFNARSKHQRCYIGCPLEAVGFLQETIKGESSFAEARDESAECGEAPCDLLNPLYALDWAHPCDG